MYNLFVSGLATSWDGTPVTLPLERCVREYTDTDITLRFGDLSAKSMTELMRFPCIFAYEAACNVNPKFGLIRDVVKRQGVVRIEYDFKEMDRFLSVEDLSILAFDLDIMKWEMNRTHWAVKNVNLTKVLHGQGIELPDWVRRATKAVDITKHKFDVALSFPGTIRNVVEPVAIELEKLIGPNTFFYDDNYIAQLARPSLDTLLQEIYSKRSRLVVVFLCEDYQKKDWCGVEFRAIKEIMMDRGQHKRVMFVKFDDGPVAGVFKTDGYVDGTKFNATQIAEFIKQRVELL